MKKVSMRNYIKSGKHWNESYHSTNPAEVYESLARNMVAKKLNACNYIKSIRRASNYDGTDTITIYYYNDVKTVYIVATH